MSTLARSLGYKPTRLNKEIINAVTEASDKFLSQLADDLGSLSKHAGRKTIDETDILIAMQR